MIIARYSGSDDVPSTVPESLPEARPASTVEPGSQREPESNRESLPGSEPQSGSKAEAEARPGSVNVSDRGDKYLVIGAGPAGLLAARSLRHYGIGYDQVDRDSDVGGIWDIERDWSPMYESAHFISSKTISNLPGFPMPDDYPDYPNHRQILTYLKHFASAFGLCERIEFNTTVTNAEKHGDTWLVELDDGSRRRYAGLIVCTGNTWDPSLPQYPGEFAGESMHSVSYRNADIFVGKRVLIVGAGNSGCDIACDAAPVARRTVISMRRGYHFIPKHLMGVPADVFAERVSLPAWMERLTFAGLLKITVGDLTKFGLPKPDHRVLESHPIMNTQLLHHLSHGDAHYRPDINNFDGLTVRFVDGSSEEFDLIVFATGYKVTFPYLDRTHFDWIGKYPDLFLSAFHRKYDNLCVLGLHQTDGGAYEFFAAQADIMSRFILDQRRDPAQARRFSRLKASSYPDLSHGLHYVKSDRHATYVNKAEFKKYTQRLIKQMGWSPIGSETSVRMHRQSVAE